MSEAGRFQPKNLDESGVSATQARKRALRDAAGDAGHEKTPLLKVIRAKCLDCTAGQAAEVRKCEIVSCALWPYRFASNPFWGSDA